MPKRPGVRGARSFRSSGKVLWPKVLWSKGQSMDEILERKINPNYSILITYGYFDLNIVRPELLIRRLILVEATGSLALMTFVWTQSTPVSFLTECFLERAGHGQRLKDDSLSRDGNDPQGPIECESLFK